jgi:hypothetical protein
MTTTLVVTRKPDDLFQNPLFPNQHGRFGMLIVLQGAKVTGVHVAPRNGWSVNGVISIPAGVLHFSAAGGGEVREIKRYRTIERMDGFVQLKPQHYKGHVYKKDAYGSRRATGTVFGSTAD